VWALRENDRFGGRGCHRSQTKTPYVKEEVDEFEQKRRQISETKTADFFNKDSSFLKQIQWNR